MQNRHFEMKKPGWVTIATFGLICALFGRGRSVQFEVEPQNQTKTFEFESILTSSIYLDCKVSYLGPHRKVSWLKNGVIVSDDYHLRSDLGHLVDPDRYSIEKYGTQYRFGMVIKDISPSTARHDSGEYQCAVTRMNDDIVSDGKSGKASVNVYVTPDAKYPICNITDLTGRKVTANDRIRAGETFRMTCESGPATPDANLYWSSRPENTLLRQYETVSADDSLTIEHVWTAVPNGGTVETFTCTLQHPGLNSNRICEIPLDVEYAPVVTLNRTDPMLIKDNNDRVSLKCQEDSNPPISEVTWYYDGDVIRDDEQFTVRGLSLNITSFGIEDNGDHNITCQTANQIGTGSASVTLKVQIVPPRFTRLPENLLSRKVVTDVVLNSPPPTQCSLCPATGKISEAFCSRASKLTLVVLGLLSYVVNGLCL